MSKRSKITIVTVLTMGIIALALTPWWIGTRIEEDLTDTLLDTMPANLRSQLSVNTLAYERGWLASNAEYEIRYQPLGMTESIPLQFSAAIQHGPLLRDRDGLRTGLAAAEIVPLIDLSELEAELEELSLTLPEVRIMLLAGLDQSIDFQISVAPTQANTAEGTFSFAGLDARLLIQTDMSAVGSFTMGQLTASTASNGDRLSIDGIAINTEAEQINNMLAPSMAMLVIPAISASGSNNFAIENIEASSRLSSSPAETGRLNMQQTISIAAIESQWQVTALDWGLNFNRVPETLLRDYSSLLLEVQNQINNQGSGTDISQLGQELGLQLLRSDLQITSNLDIDMFGGNNLVELQLDYAGLPKLPGLGSLTAEALLSAINLSLDVDLDLDAVLASPVAGLIDPYVQEGYIEISNGRILMQAALVDGELQINGSSTSVEQFL